MPIYEYECGQCANKFEELVRGDKNPRCPACGSANTKKLVSVCARHKGGAGDGDFSLQAPGGGGCGGCSGGNCASCGR